MNVLKSYALASASVLALAANKPRGLVGAVRSEGPANIEQLMKDVKSELDRVTSDVKKIAEDANKEAKNAGKLSEEVKDKADKALSAQNALQQSFEKLTGKLDEISQRQTDTEQKLLARNQRGDERPKSVGQLVTDDEKLRSFVAGGARGSVRIPVKNAITSGDASAGALIIADRETQIVEMARRRLTVRQLLTQGRTGSDLIEYARQVTRTNNPNVVSEGAEKPESAYAWEKDDAKVVTIAHWVAVSKQAAADAGQLQTEINSELLYGLKLKEELEILAGSGVGDHLNGLITQATPYSAAFAVSEETMIDKLRLALLQASLAEYPADGMVLNPTDWARIELTKDGEARYIFANPLALAGPTLWGLPVVPTQSMTVDKFLAGAFKTAATVYDREDAAIEISSEDRDNFIKNMLTVRAEERLALAVKRAAALIYGDFGNL